LKILVAEDDALSRTLLERTLHRAGYEVISAVNGTAAIEELTKDDPPRLALLDWVMPGKDGVEVCREMRRRKDQPYAYLILLSSRESKEDIVQGLESGADDYLTKPFDGDELKARLRVGERILELEDRLVEAREGMRFQATHDPLTSLWSRGVIVELITREVERSHREKSLIAVMMCDIDHFKSVNDKYGHLVGDDVLREVSRRLQNSVRSYDMVGRFGGEEFIIVLNKCDPSSVISRAENLRNSIAAKLIQASPNPLQITVSLGMALSSEFPTSSADELIYAADQALYAAKAAGRNCIRLAALPNQRGKAKPAEETLPTEIHVIP
jgi:two-component system, cell cycle response regulator